MTPELYTSQDRSDTRTAAKPSKVYAPFDSLPDSSFIREAQLVRHAKNPDVPVLLPFSAATLWRYVRSGNFPQPVKLSRGVTVWLLGDVRKWITARFAETTALAAV